MGQMAVAALLERLERGRTRQRRVVLAPTLVVRGTTGPPPRERKVRP
jgi:DNA-binding LacI/PurR family transcriptional regulator